MATYYNDDTYSLHQFSTIYATCERQIRQRLDQIPQAASKPKDPAAPKKDWKKPEPREPKEPRADKSADQGQADGKPAIICYNYQKQGHIAKNCPEPLSDRRKQYLAYMIKELKDAKQGKDQGNDDL